MTSKSQPLLQIIESHGGHSIHITDLVRPDLWAMFRKGAPSDAWLLLKQAQTEIAVTGAAVSSIEVAGRPPLRQAR